MNEAPRASWLWDDKVDLQAQLNFYTIAALMYILVLSC